MEFTLLILTLCLLGLIFKLKEVIKERDSAEKRATIHFKNSNRFEKQNQQYQKEHEILLENASELRNTLRNIDEILQSDLITFDKCEEIRKELVDNLQTEN